MADVSAILAYVGSPGAVRRSTQVFNVLQVFWADEKLISNLCKMVLLTLLDPPLGELISNVDFRTR
jgi:hypothetical protein